jgi:hypothetical protein
MCQLSSHRFSTTDLRNCFQIGFCPMTVRHPLQTGPNSLFRNILTINPCASIFYPYQGRSHPGKSLRMNILGEQPKKKLPPAANLCRISRSFCTLLPLTALTGDFFGSIHNYLNPIDLNEQE